MQIAVGKYRRGNSPAEQAKQDPALAREDPYPDPKRRDQFLHFSVMPGAPPPASKSRLLPILHVVVVHAGQQHTPAMLRIATHAFDVMPSIPETVRDESLSALTPPCPHAVDHLNYALTWGLLAAATAWLGHRVIRQRSLVPRGPTKRK